MGRQTLPRKCPAGTIELLGGFTLKIDEGSVVAAGSEPRAFEIETDDEATVLWRVHRPDDGSTELMRVLSHDEVVGQFDDADGSKYSVAFTRTAEWEKPSS